MSCGAGVLLQSPPVPAPGYDVGWFHDNYQLLRRELLEQPPVIVHIPAHTDWGVDPLRPGVLGRRQRGNCPCGVLQHALNCRREPDLCRLPHGGGCHPWLPRRLLAGVRVLRAVHDSLLQFRPVRGRHQQLRHTTGGHSQADGEHRGWVGRLRQERRSTWGDSLSHQSHSAFSDSCSSWTGTQTCVCVWGGGPTFRGSRQVTVGIAQTP